MSTFKITKNGVDLRTGLTENEALKSILVLTEDFSNGYIYDNESETIYHEVDHAVVAKYGDRVIDAGDDRFEIESENI